MDVLESKKWKRRVILEVTNTVSEEKYRDDLIKWEVSYREWS